MPARVVAGVVPGIGSPAGLDGVAYVVARMAREALDADRVGVLLLDAAGRLLPAAAAARHPDPVAHARFLAMPPLALDAFPRAHDLMRIGQPVVVPNAGRSPYLPAAWVAEFGVDDLVLAPLIVDGVPHGLVVVLPRPGQRPDTRALRLLATTCRAGASELRGARAYDAAAAVRRGLDTMLALTADLNAATTLQRVVEIAVDGMLGLLDAVSCSLGLFEGAGALRTLATRGEGQPAVGTHPLPASGAAVRDEFLALWRHEPASPRLLDATAARAFVPDGAPLVAIPAYVVLPVVLDGVPAGVLVAGRASRAPLDPQLLVVARTVVSHVSLAIERARLHDDVARRLQRMELLQRLADDVAVEADMRVVLDRLAPAVRAATGGELIDAYLCEPSAASLFSTPVATGPLAALLHSRRRHRFRGLCEAGGLAVVPMVVDDEVVGALRVRPTGATGFDRDDERYLLALAAGVGDVVTRATVRAQVVEAQRQHAVCEERERLARDLHDTLGQALFGIGLKLDECAANAPDEATRSELGELRVAISTANRDVRQAIHALSFLERGRNGLVPSLAELSRTCPRGEGCLVEVRVEGPPRCLPARQEDALYRVVHEALANVRKHSNASLATIEVVFARDRVTVSVTDDGDGIAACPEDQPGLHFGLRTMRRRMEEVGGGLAIRNAEPQGVRVLAWVPVS